MVWDRQAGLHAGGGRPTEAFAAFCGQLRVGWHFCDAGDPQAKGVVERLLDPALAGRRVEARISDREVLAVALDSGELACRHARSFAKHRTITALEHARTLKLQRHERRGSDEAHVEIRSLAAYDALIA